MMMEFYFYSYILHCIQQKIPFWRNEIFSATFKRHMAEKSKMYYPLKNAILFNAIAWKSTGFLLVQPNAYNILNLKRGIEKEFILTVFSSIFIFVILTLKKQKFILYKKKIFYCGYVLVDNFCKKCAFFYSVR